MELIPPYVDTRAPPWRAFAGFPGVGASPAAEAARRRIKVPRFESGAGTTRLVATPLERSERFKTNAHQ